MNNFIVANYTPKTPPPPLLISMFIIVILDCSGVPNHTESLSSMLRLLLRKHMMYRIANPNNIDSFSLQQILARVVGRDTSRLWLTGWVGGYTFELGSNSFGFFIIVCFYFVLSFLSFFSSLKNITANTVLCTKNPTKII